jgi:ferredoxin
MRVTVDRDNCMASGACVRAAPEVFAQDDDGIVVIRRPSPSPELEEKARAAIRACPAAVIWSDD